MKTFCVVLPDNTSYTLNAASVFEVVPEIALSESSIANALLEHRPLSLRMPWGWITRNDASLPVKVNGISLRRINPNPYNTVKLGCQGLISTIFLYYFR